ncbi:MAG: GNAT family N-acetyltransferase [Phycisphaerae bacterium]|nr:GNAT family N-acetyltransferase [Phycisphaerae bacterium]
MTHEDFTFLDPGTLVDQELQLVLKEKTPADPAKGYVPAYVFDMTLADTQTVVGSINFRVGDTDFLVRYGGHIGYEVNPEHRGHRFAARSCLLLFPLARAHGLKQLWLTVTPENTPSRRTCEILGAEMVEIVDLPKDSDMYAHGERQKCRYRIDL